MLNLCSLPEAKGCQIGGSCHFCIILQLNPNFSFPCHSHCFGLTVSGLVEPAVTSDEKPHTILEYSNGPGYKVTRANLSGVDIGTFYFQFYTL